MLKRERKGSFRERERERERDREREKEREREKSEREREREREKERERERKESTAAASEEARAVCCCSQCRKRHRAGKTRALSNLKKLQRQSSTASAKTAKFCLAFPQKTRYYKFSEDTTFRPRERLFQVSSDIDNS
jgi:hypothetical protein